VHDGTTSEATTLRLDKNVFIARLKLLPATTLLSNLSLEYVSCTASAKEYFVADILTLIHMYRYFCFLLSNYYMRNNDMN